MRTSSSLKPNKRFFSALVKTVGDYNETVGRSQRETTHSEQAKERCEAPQKRHLSTKVRHFKSRKDRVESDLVRDHGKRRAGMGKLHERTPKSRETCFHASYGFRHDNSSKAGFLEPVLDIDSKGSVK